MFAYIKREFHFLCMIAYGKNVSQVKEIIKRMNAQQTKLFQFIARDILQGKLSLTKAQFKKLEKFKHFLRILGKGWASRITVLKKFKVIKSIVAIALKSYEICGQICSGASKKMGRNNTKRKPSEKRKLVRQVSAESSDSSISTTQCSEDQARNSDSYFYSSSSSEEEEAENNAEEQQEENKEEDNMEYSN